MKGALQEGSRREFLSGAGRVAVAAGAAAALLTSEAQAHDKTTAHRREIIPGSPSPAYSRATKLGNLVFVAGCVGVTRTEGKSVMADGFEAQARQTLMNLKASVEAAGSSLDKVLKCTCFLKEFADFKTFNEVYMSIFPEPRPARSTVVVKDFVVPGALVEVDCVCAI